MGRGHNPVLFICVDAFLLKTYNKRMKKPISKTSKSDSQKKLAPEVREALDSYHLEMQKYVDTLQKRSDEDIKRYIGSLTEEYQGRTSAVAEQFSGLNEKIDTIKETLDEHGRILEMHTEMIGTLMEDVSVLKEDVAVLKDDVSEIKDELKNKADKTEVIHLSRRVSVLERNV